MFKIVFQQIQTNQQQQFQAQQQMTIQSQQQAVNQAYPHGQTLPANALQGIVATHVGAHPTQIQSHVNVTHPQAMSMGHVPNSIELNMNMASGMNAMPAHNTGYIQQQQPQQQTNQLPSQTHSQSQQNIQSVTSMPNQHYVNNHSQSIGSNINVSYSMPMQKTQDIHHQVQSQIQNQQPPQQPQTQPQQQPQQQQQTVNSQMNGMSYDSVTMNNVNQTNMNVSTMNVPEFERILNGNSRYFSKVQPNYVNTTMQPHPQQAQSQPILVQQIQPTQQANVVNNPNRNNVIGSETGNYYFQSNPFV